MEGAVGTGMRKKCQHTKPSLYRRLYAPPPPSFIPLLFDYISILYGSIMVLTSDDCINT